MWQDIKKKLPECKTAKLVTAFLILRKKKKQQQNYPKYINDVVSKILEKKKTISRCFVSICDLPEIVNSHPTIKWR